MTLQEKIDNYKTTDTNKELVRATELVLIAGVVSAGKDTMVQQLLRDPNFAAIVSHTTRQPRTNHGVLEQSGRDYHFISLDEAERMVDEREFIEVKYVHDNVYGTSAVELERIHDAGKYAVTDIDIQGVQDFLAIKPDAKAIFLLPPSVATWLTRLENRYGSLDLSSPEIRKRFATAAKEIEYILRDDRFIIIINDDRQTTLDRIRQVIEGEKESTSDYAEATTDHLLEYINSVV